MPGMPGGGRRRRHWPNRYEVHKAKARGQAVAVVVLAGVVLVLLFVFVDLLVGERDGTGLDLARPLRTGPRQ
jgi:hypothetical protein